MFKGFYTVASGMIAQQRRTELLTNNMANVNTPGYKTDQSTIRSFPEMLLSRTTTQELPIERRMSLQGLAQVGPISTGVYMQETIPSFEQGALMETELSTDVALTNGNVVNEAGQTGTLFFRLAHPENGEYYTRNGNFTLDAQGNLVNPQGLFVLDENGDRIQLQNDDFQLMDDGRILVDGQETARIGIAYSADPSTLQKQDNGLYRTADEANLQPAQNEAGITYSMQQGYLEQSNVDSARTMTDLLTAYRAFEANQKVMQAYDRSMEKAVNEIGRV